MSLLKDKMKPDPEEHWIMIGILPRCAEKVEQTSWEDHFSEQEM